jgi:hypothetical protein
MSQPDTRSRDITLIALWGVLNLCSFFFVIEGAVVLLLLALATEGKIRVAWLGIPVLVGLRVLTGNLWWNSTGAREKFAVLQIVWVVLAVVATVQSLYFFFSLSVPAGKSVA